MPGFPAFPLLCSSTTGGYVQSTKLPIPLLGHNKSCRDGDSHSAWKQQGNCRGRSKPRNVLAASPSASTFAHSLFVISLFDLFYGKVPTIVINAAIVLSCWGAAHVFCVWLVLRLARSASGLRNPAFSSQSASVGRSRLPGTCHRSFRACRLAGRFPCGAGPWSPPVARNHATQSTPGRLLYCADTMRNAGQDLVPNRSTGANPAAPYYPALDGLRAFAVLIVFVGHYTGQFFGFPSVAGVEIFFVLSGFLITGLLFDAQDKPHPYRNFYARRCLRILPLYYFVWIVFALATPAIHIHWYPFTFLWPLHLGNYIIALAPLYPRLAGTFPLQLTYSLAGSPDHLRLFDVRPFLVALRGRTVLPGLASGCVYGQKTPPAAVSLPCHLSSFATGPHWSDEGLSAQRRADQPDHPAFSGRLPARGAWGVAAAGHLCSQGPAGWTVPALERLRSPAGGKIRECPVLTSRQSLGPRGSVASGLWLSGYAGCISGADPCVFESPVLGSSCLQSCAGTRPRQDQLRLLCLP